MKKALLKDSVKEIRNTYKRFISILLMAFLGVGFFAGIRATSPDMVDTIDQYYKAQNVYDIEVVSTLGLTKEDIDELYKIDSVDKVEGSYETDGKIEIDNKEIVTKVISIDEINKPLLLEGSLPQNEDECVVEKSFLSSNQKKIGDTIEVEIENTTNDEGEEKEYLKHKEMKIVGTVQSPLYISRDRGSSKLGSGKVNYYIYIAKGNINVPEIYTAIYLKIKDADQYKTSSKTYENKVEEVKEKIESIKEQREKTRYDALVGTATDKVTEAEGKLNLEKQEAQDKINQAEKELEDGKQEIADSESKINANKQKADTEFANASKKIKEAEKTIKFNEEQLSQKETEANNQFQELEQQKESFENQLEQANYGLEQINTQYTRNFGIFKKSKFNR